MPSPVQGHQYMDLDDFEDLELQRPEHEKWELIGGRVVRSMVGARWSHHAIVQNVNLALSNHLRERGLPCRTFTESFWLKQRFLNLAVFPDIMVRCGPMDDVVSIDDPMIVVEVISPSSEARDRGAKAQAYMRLASLRHICLITRDSVLIEGYDRSKSGWALRPPVESIEAMFELPAISFTMPVAEVYRDVLPPRMPAQRTSFT
jgi:Uma2 family endonuclease